LGFVRFQLNLSLLSKRWLDSLSTRLYLMNLVSLTELALVFLVLPAVGGVVAFVSRYLLPEEYEKYLSVSVLAYLIYFGGTLVYTVFVSELRETPVLGIYLGESPVFAMILTAFGVGMAVGVGAHKFYETPSDRRG